jgi:uncharacterized membrane-anchored protein
VDSRRSVPAPVLTSFRKVPEVTAVFWIAKVLTTGMGEATSDFLVHQLAPIVAVAIGAFGLAVALALQFRAPRYNPWIYWLAVAMVAVYRTEHTLSIHSIDSPRREAFYWLTVISTFALGTAAGDMTATTFHLGYLVSGLAFTVLIAVPAVAHRWFGLNAIVAFWFAYIVTRPLGASFADWLGVSHARGGLNWGTGAVSIGAAILIAGVVAYMAATQPATSANARRNIATD